MSKNSYSLKLTPKASKDLDKIYRYITEELYAEQAAVNLLEKIETSVMRLKDFPFSGNYFADEYLKKKGYRKLIIDNYIDFYVVDEEEKQVVVMRFLYGRQKYEGLL
ncbi:type II toxin-antitoxin system RelE/ParE family toxin [Desulfoscipio gibsoniae]|uniref:Addiction module toxin, RelE/StbE family n=1 Tax=Desulfoscipio gibsoniae DSM 7213 TaxID=767817 RepID=R4KVL1_9FIRM|nr:type II toxin-antitoxin system mRNA interferase toxin, RelE/StbE family [Desulfoscipio gibsoniae]AGL03661.1 addiction module toxin, RelE/StbE family [Desulfoscipio gibsoniae DSM 7213]